MSHWTKKDVENWKVGDRAFWDCEEEYPSFMPNWVRLGFEKKEEFTKKIKNKEK